MKNKKLYLDCGCKNLDQDCSINCTEFANCNARLIVAELKRPLPSGKPYIPKAKSIPEVTNADLAKAYGVTKRQVVKARKQATSNTALRNILQGLKNT